MKKKKIVFMSADYGAGHITSVKAICEALDKYAAKQYDYEMVDTAKILGPIFDKYSEKFYKNTVKYSKKSYKFLFELTENFDPSRFDRFVYPFIKKYLDELFYNKPDLVISSFPLLTYAIAKYFEEEGNKVPLVMLVTDTGEVHNFWAVRDVDYFLVPTVDTGFYLAEKGIEKEKIFSLGYPMRQQFYKKYDRNKTLQELGLPIDKKTIMFFSGAWGVGKVKKKVDYLDKYFGDISIIVVCGNNTALKKRIDNERYLNNVFTMGFIDNVAEIMSACDLVISKAGGNSFMEVITMKKPMIISEVFPGQEEPNARFTEMMGFGYVEENPEDLAKRIKYVFTTDDYQRLERNLKNYTLNDETDKKIIKFIGEVLSKVAKV